MKPTPIYSIISNNTINCYIKKNSKNHMNLIVSKSSIFLAKKSLFFLHTYSCIPFPFSRKITSFFLENVNLCCTSFLISFFYKELLHC